MSNHERDGWRIDVRCDVQGAGHRKRGVQVTSFIHNGDGSWHEYVAGPWRAKHLTGDDGIGSEVILTGEDVPTAKLDRGEWFGTLMSDDPEDRAKVAALRHVYVIVCPVCAPDRTARRYWPEKFRRAPGPSVDLTEPKLFEVLNLARHAGRTYLTMTELRSIVQGMAQRA